VGSVGPALPGAEIKILAPDETGTGEILIRGPMVMRGYYKNPTATEEVMEEGWFHSGDLGRLDSRGNLFITGRKKEVIVLPNGKNIYPDELESHYLQTPYVQELAVIGVSSPQERGERLHAVVVPNFDYLKSKRIANAREALRDQIAGLSNQLPKYKRLMSYQLQSDPLPRTTTRKIKRLELKKLVESGQLRTQDDARAAPDQEDRSILQSAVGQEVIQCLRETYRRDRPIEPSMNLELDLGFDSMERVELLASIEQTLDLHLPEDFGAEIFTVRDLIVQLEQQAGIVSRSGGQERQSWEKILSAESISREEAASFHLSGPVGAFLKFLLLRLIYYALFKTLLRLETRGLQHLPSKGPYLICPNHQSYLDGFVLASTLPFHIFRNMFFVGYSFMFTSWFMKLIARLTNIVPVDPDAHLLKAMRAGARGLREGRILCIFPEGGRSFDGSLQEFKKGAAILSRELSVPIIPVAIQGTHRVWPRDSVRIRPHRVRIEFGSLVQPFSADVADPYKQDVFRLHEIIASML
jgi:long-chain acyl-CoA synthetase